MSQSVARRSGALLSRGVKAIESFKFKDVISKLGPRAGVDKDVSVLATLADRARDRKTAVRVAAMSHLRVISREDLKEKEAGEKVAFLC